MTDEAEVLALPDGGSLLWGGRAPETPGEVAWCEALRMHASRRRWLGRTTEAQVQARRALLAAVAAHGPNDARSRRARETFDAARAETQSAARALEAAARAMGKALDLWGGEAARPSGVAHRGAE